MLATSASGGIVSVIEAWRAIGLFERWPIECVSTHCEGGALRKAWVALKALARVAGAIVRHGPVVLHVHSACDTSFWRKAVFMALGLATRCAVVFHLHGGRFVEFYDKECGALGRRVIRFFLARASCIVVLSEGWASWVRSVSGNPRIVCVPNPVLVGAPRRAARRRHTILFMGLLTPAKGLLELIEALAVLRRRFSDSELVCAGQGEGALLTAHARRFGVADAVSFPGWVEGEAKEAWMARAAVFALPSHAEGMPMSLLEAMAAGLPAVASAVGSVPEVLEDGVNGLLVRPRDAAGLATALERLLEDPAFAARLADAARETVRRRFAGGAVLAELERVYAGLGLAARVPSGAAATPRPA